MSKKKIIIFSIIVLLVGVGIVFVLKNKEKIGLVPTSTETNQPKELPKPEISGGARGELGIDKNINENTIDEYLNREDSVYRDMRMLEDPGNYEAIGGDRFLSGYVEGFEVIPLPYIIPVTDLPGEVGDTYTGTTLFYNDNGTYIANYEESISLIEEIFPKDKVIFLMCGGGGYAGMAKNFLVSLGWDENKIYNVGAYWNYKGEHNIIIKKEVDGRVSYDFDSVPYHKIEFDKLTKTTEYKKPDVRVTELKINTKKIEIEEKTSFKLNAIVLPNNATNKDVKWTSSDEKVATVDGKGLVKAIGAGEAVVTAKALGGNKTITCNVIVTERDLSMRIELDDVSEEAKEFALIEFNKIEKEFDELTENADGSKKEEYVTPEGGANDLWRDEYAKHEIRREEATNQRSEILGKLINNKKSFIMLIHFDDCEEKKYSVVDGAEKLLKQKNIPYFNIGDLRGDMTRINIDTEEINVGSVVIMKNGEFYVTINPEVDAIKSDEELTTWLSKYIDVD